MQPLKTFYIDTRHGRVLYAAETMRPRVLLFHGVRRVTPQLEPWRARIPDLGLVSLPGHGRAPPFAEVTLEAWIAGFTEMLAHWEEPPLLIAESLGAMVAMCLPGKALIAVEPLLSTHQLWPLRRTIRSARASGLGFSEDLEALFARPFHWALARLQPPTLVLAGQEPLMPERAVFPTPSLLSDEDFQAYAAHPRVEAAIRIPGGHTLMDFSQDAIMAVSADFRRRHGYPELS
jgi:hypothetical protein